MTQEDSLQIACVEWFDYQYPELSKLLFHIPNGGSRHIAEAKKFKKMGVRSGVPDLFLSKPKIEVTDQRTEISCGVYFELKSLKGRMTKEQKQFRELVMSVGYKHYVIKTLDDFRFLTKLYLS